MFNVQTFGPGRVRYSHVFGPEPTSRSVFVFQDPFFQASNLTPKTPDAVIAPYSRGSVLPETALGFSK